MRKWEESVFFTCNLHHLIQYFLSSSSLCLTGLLTQIGSWVFYKFAILFLTSKQPQNRAGLLFNLLPGTNASSEVRPIIGIIDDCCSTYQYWNSSSLILCLKYRFILHIILYLLIFWVFIVSGRYYRGSVIERQLS